MIWIVIVSKTEDQIYFQKYTERELNVYTFRYTQATYDFRYEIVEFTVKKNKTISTKRKC